MHHASVRVLVPMLVACALAARGSSQAPPGGTLVPAPQLAADTLFPALGTTATCTLSGPAGGSYFFLLSFAPGEAGVGAWGTLFLDPASFLILTGGVLPPSGSVALPLPVPAVPEAVGLFFYAQGAVKLGAERGLSNALAFRIENVPPFGARHPVAIGATPDGSRAFVCNEEDGSLSVIDAAADSKLLDLPVGEDPGDVAVDPQGRHAFVVNRGSAFLTVLDAASSSVVAQVPVPKACRRIAFDFSGSTPRLYVTNARDDDVLVFAEGPPGHFTALAPLLLQGHEPGPVTVLPNGQLAVGDFASHAIEFLDPLAPAGSQTVAFTPFNGVPFDVLVDGAQLLVPTFDFSTPTTTANMNRVLELNLQTHLFTGHALDNVGTDYIDVALAGPWLAIVSAGSGTAEIANGSTFALAQHIDLAPGGPGFTPNATPQRAAFITPGGGAPTKLYVAEYFRETVRPIVLGAGPPFTLLPEIALAHAGVPLLPLTNLTPEDNGEWFFRSVQFLNGTPKLPNLVTCATCHPDGGSDGFDHGNQTPTLFGAGDTAPYGWGGAQPDLLLTIDKTFQAHSQFGGTIPQNGDQLILAYLTDGNPAPESPFLAPDGSLPPDAQAGKSLFEGVAGCASCHAAPVFIPAPPAPLTINAGVGTGLAPINVPSLRGLWTTAPYLHDGSAPTLDDVLLDNPGNQHGLTSTLTAQQRAEIVAYLRTL